MKGGFGEHTPFTRFKGGFGENTPFIQLEHELTHETTVIIEDTSASFKLKEATGLHINICQQRRDAA